MENDADDQFHFDPESYMEMILSEIPAYFDLQEATVEATAGVALSRILELGVGTGETSARLVAVHREAHLTGIDESEGMLDHARRRLPGADLRVGRLEDPLPAGTYDLVVSALAVHHLDDQAKADLFARVAAQLRPGGRFVLADVVIPVDPGDIVTPIDDDGYDKPSPVADQIRWLLSAGFSPRVAWTNRDLAVIAADRA
jgi:tRNA (cmo5U34)-methyltransferase